VLTGSRVAPGVAGGDVRLGDGDAVPAGVRDQGLRCVEGRRLGLEQGGIEHGGEVALEPGAVVHEHREANRVGLGNSLPDTFVGLLAACRGAAGSGASQCWDEVRTPRVCGGDDAIGCPGSRR